MIGPRCREMESRRAASYEAVSFITPISTVIVSITAPTSTDTSMVSARELTGTARDNCKKSSQYYCRSSPALALAT